MSLLNEYKQWLNETSKVSDQDFVKTYQSHFGNAYDPDADNFDEAREHATKHTMESHGLNKKEFDSQMKKIVTRLESGDNLNEGEHWDKVRRSNTTEIQNAQQYAQQMVQDHGDDETVQKLAAVILKLNPNNKEHQDQILDAAKQLDDYVAQQVGHEPTKEKK